MKTLTPKDFTLYVDGIKVSTYNDWPLGDFQAYEWLSLKNFGKKENTMEYMTNQMLQRFMSHMASQLTKIQITRKEVEDEIKFCKSDARFWEHLPFWYGERQIFRNDYVKFSKLQQEVKYNYLSNPRLQRMEKVVTKLIELAQLDKEWAYEDYLLNQYDPFYRKCSKQAKQKLKKLVELQHAIRKQKSITKD